MGDKIINMKYRCVMLI